MKPIGAALLLLSGLLLRRTLLGRLRDRIAVGEELCRALDRLCQGVYRLRRPLPGLLTACRKSARLTGPFWGAVEAGLHSRRPFPAVWEEALSLLPSPYDTLMAPLGPALTAGQREDLIHLTREEVYRAVREGRRQRGERERLVTTLCLSGSALLFILFS